MTDDQKRETLKYRFGYWYSEWEEDGIKKRMEIFYTNTGESYFLEFKEFENDVLVNADDYYPSSTWIAHWLILSGHKRLFYIESANETEMYFGEANTNVVGDRKWQRKFVRKKS